MASRSLLFNRPRNKPAASVPVNCDRVLRQLFPLLRQVQVHLPDVGIWGPRARHAGTRRLGFASHSARICAGDLEWRVSPPQRLTCGSDFFSAKRRPVNVVLARHIRRTPANHRLATDEGGFPAGFKCCPDCGFDRGGMVSVDIADDAPPISLEAAGCVVGEPAPARGRRNRRLSGARPRGCRSPPA